MEHAKFIRHAGKEVFVLDFTDKKPAAALDLIEECARQVRTRPEASVRTLTLVAGGTFSQEVPHGNTSQIDHLVLSIYGIFVIETKNYINVFE